MAEKQQKMAKKQRKTMEFEKRTTRVVSESLHQANTSMKKRKSKKAAEDGRRKKSGPHLPSSLLKELGFHKHNPNSSDHGEREEESEDLYEYEEPPPEEETKKNRRFDQVENYEYELPDDFKDEDVPSDEDDRVSLDEEDGVADEEGEEQDAREKHVRMLQSITGLPVEAFKDKQKKYVALSDAQGGFVSDKISINDLLDPLHGKPGYSQLRKRLHHLDRAPMAVQAPLSKVEREKLERKVTYEQSKKEITKWEPLVKRNREAPTLYFVEDAEVGVSTVEAIAAEHKPRTEFEKKIAELVGDPEIMEAHRKDGARLLELNKISFEDVRDRQNRLAKMRSLLFHHEMKSKHIKKIKSKTYHRIMKKERQKKASAEIDVDPEAAKELANKREFKRAEERMTLKHKNSSKWAKRIFKRGLKAQDDGTRAAIAEQLHQHALLTRKMNSMNDNSSSDETSDDESDELSPGLDSEGVSKLLNKAKEKTIKVMEEDEMSKSGVFTLPFMERSLKKQREAANEEARLALQEYKSSLLKLEGDEGESPLTDIRNGRRIFVGVNSQPKMSNTREAENCNDSDSEGDFGIVVEEEDNKVENCPQNAQIGFALLSDDAERDQETLFKDLDYTVKNPGSKRTHEVAICASDTWTKMGDANLADNVKNRSAVAGSLVLPSEDLMGNDDNSDSDSDTEMVDGFLSSGPRSDYKLPSQDDLISRAFAGDDVEADFEKEKMDALNEENPEPQKPVLLPGWGQWTHIQEKKGIPSFMIEEHENMKKKREEALKKRKDAHLKHVIISEKIDKKAEKLHARNLPYPYTSKEVYEQSIRMPIGPDYNPAISIGSLNRPSVVKRAGIIIKPIKYENIDPYGKSEDKEPKQSMRKSNSKEPKQRMRKSNSKEPKQRMRKSNSKEPKQSMRKSNAKKAKHASGKSS